MRLSTLILSMASVGMAPGDSISAPFTCETGVLKGDICCSDGCGECGGSGCRNRGPGLTGEDCCHSAIRATGVMCSWESGPPCIMSDSEESGDPPTPSPSTTSPPTTPSPQPTNGEPFTCANGVRKGDVCCSDGCGECGGSGCRNRGPGLTGEDCCHSAIRASNVVCSWENGPPCIMSGEPEDPPTPSPTTPSSPATPSPLPTGEPFTCDDGVLKGDICCSDGCGECGGSNCGDRGNGLTADDCCHISIRASGRFCSQTEAAPCVMDVTPAPAPVPTLAPLATGAGTPMCRNGFYGFQDKDFCCPVACGYCGGDGCGTRNGVNCCTSATTDSCSQTGSAPCVMDPISKTWESPDCSHTPAIDMSDPEAIYLRSGGCVTLTDIYDKQASGDGPLWVIDSDNKVVSGVEGPPTPTGYWLLTSSLIIVDNVKLIVSGTGIGGDCDVLRIQSTDSEFWEVTGHGGSLHFEGTTVTSWDTDRNTEREHEDAHPRSFMRCLTQYDDSEKYSCTGSSNNDKGTCRMDLLDSTFGNMGYMAPESYGLVWKVRGLCTDLSNVDTIFEDYQVYGDIKNSDIYGMYYGQYSYGHQGGVWTNNKMHHNIQYGFDPHDDSDDLTIAFNEVYSNGNHGIIASKRCNNVQIYNNTVYDGDQVGIFLHRSSDDATVYYNNIYNNKDAGIAFMESFGGKIFNNTITNCKYGLRLSLGAEENTFMHNTMTDIGLDPDNRGTAIFTYEGSDAPIVSSNGRPRDNVFSFNTITNANQAVKLKDADDNVFSENSFNNAGQFEFPDSTNTLWTDNTITGDGCIEEDDVDEADFVDGSDDIPEC